MVDGVSCLATNPDEQLQKYAQTSSRRGALTYLSKLIAGRCFTHVGGRALALWQYHSIVAKRIFHWLDATDSPILGPTVKVLPAVPAPPPSSRMHPITVTFPSLTSLPAAHGLLFCIGKHDILDLVDCDFEIESSQRIVEATIEAVPEPIIRPQHGAGA